MDKYTRIIEWLFVNGKDWQCPQEFREKFITLLYSELVGNNINQEFNEALKNYRG